MQRFVRVTGSIGVLSALVFLSAEPAAALTLETHEAGLLGYADPDPANEGDEVLQTSEVSGPAQFVAASAAAGAGCPVTPCVTAGGISTLLGEFILLQSISAVANGADSGLAAALLGVEREDDIPFTRIVFELTEQVALNVDATTAITNGIEDLFGIPESLMEGLTSSDTPEDLPSGAAGFLWFAVVRENADGEEQEEILEDCVGNIADICNAESSHNLIYATPEAEGDKLVFYTFGGAYAAMLADGDPEEGEEQLARFAGDLLVTVPEPATAVLLGAGLLGLVAAGRTRRS